jgi:hypothetical protein
VKFIKYIYIYMYTYQHFLLCLCHLSLFNPFAIGTDKHRSKQTGSEQHHLSLVGALLCMQKDELNDEHCMGEKHQTGERTREEHHTIHIEEHHMGIYTSMDK